MRKKRNLTPPSPFSSFAIPPTPPPIPFMSSFRTALYSGPTALDWYSDFELPFWMMFATVCVVRIQVWWKLRAIKKRRGE